ncbi:hypothetical protein EVAR_12311_1 [Eumeta japonica]|uniref:Reverse transcriptase domain-containing protein n=1 Tax=Eumeta variegata TaxID=151549 RepID=A0A4C1TUN4_EUMVA|nr:hypothetical protein EVAR_12311_1 [Eumeta japonica]
MSPAAEDQVILASSAYWLQEMVNKMNDSVKKSGMKANVGKTNVMMFKRDESTPEYDILVEEGSIPIEVDFKYALGISMTAINSGNRSE